MQILICQIIYFVIVDPVMQLIYGLEIFLI
jgi:hypothetical protein